jgi:hypothetical protein
VPVSDHEGNPVLCQPVKRGHEDSNVQQLRLLHANVARLDVYQHGRLRREVEGNIVA